METIKLTEKNSTRIKTLASQRAAIEAQLNEVVLTILDTLDIDTSNIEGLSLDEKIENITYKIKSNDIINAEDTNTVPEVV